MDFANVADPELRKKLQEVAATHRPAATDIPPEVNQFPRYVFNGTTPDRAPGATVMVSNGLTEDRGGTVLEKVGRAYRVEVSGVILIVHEPEDSWEP